MAYNASFDIEINSNPSTFTLVDSSTGSDPNLTGRLIYIYKTDGNLLTSPIPWPIANSSISLDVLSQDYALNIRVDVLSSDPLPTPSTYTYSQIEAFVKYGKDFLYNLTQYQQSNPSVVQDKDWYNNKVTVFCEILSAQNAIEDGEDVFGAQQCISRYQQYINNQNDYF